MANFLRIFRITPLFTIQLLIWIPWLTSCASTECNRDSAAKGSPSPASIAEKNNLTTSNGSPYLDLSHKKEFVSHPNWLAVNLDFSKYEKVRLQIEQILGRKLKHRGEAHITILSPPEYEIIKPYVSMKEIEAALDPRNIQSTVFTELCIGEFTLSRGKKSISTFFIPVSSPGLLALRYQIYKLVLSKGGSWQGYENIDPHITLGFDERDIHKEEGAIKDKSSCRYPLQNLRM